MKTTIKILKSYLSGRLKRIGYALLCFSFLFLNITSLSASEDESIKVEISENSTIIISASDSCGVSISEGKITAVAGKSVRLLPGTIIKGSQPVTVSISSKEDIEKVAKKIAKEREEEMLAEVVAKREQIKQISEIPLFCRFNQLPAKEEIIGKQKIQLIASVTNTTISFSSPLCLLMKKTAANNIQQPGNKNQSIFYISGRSWGEISGTIKVLRC